MSEKNKSGFLAANPEKAMIIMFPIISLSLFVVGAILWWAIQIILGY